MAVRVAEKKAIDPAYDRHEFYVLNETAIDYCELERECFKKLTDCGVSRPIKRTSLEAHSDYNRGRPDMIRMLFIIELMTQEEAADLAEENKIDAVMMPLVADWLRR
jgi:hypothetical protein